MKTVVIRNVLISELMGILQEASTSCRMVDLVITPARQEVLIEPCNTDLVVSVRITDDIIEKLM